MLRLLVMQAIAQIAQDCAANAFDSTDFTLLDLRCAYRVAKCLIESLPCGFNLDIRRDKHLTLFSECPMHMAESYKLTYHTAICSGREALCGRDDSLIEVCRLCYFLADDFLCKKTASILPKALQQVDVRLNCYLNKSLLPGIQPFLYSSG